jgi:hypothetical protein
MSAYKLFFAIQFPVANGTQTLNLEIMRQGLYHCATATNKM